MMLRPYPDRRRAAALLALGDLLVLAWTAAAIVAAIVVHQLVSQLGEVAQGVTGAGQALNGWLDAFRSTPVANIPFVGSALSDYVGGLLNHLQAHSGDHIVSLGTAAGEAVPKLALVLAVTVAAVPILTVTVHYVLWRLRDSRARGEMLAYIRGVSAEGRLEEAHALLAVRAVATLPLPQLASVSADPVGDLRSGHHRALSVALLGAAGLDEGRLRRPGS